MAAGEKPYRVYRGGRQKGKVPLQRRVDAPRGSGNGAGGRVPPPRPEGMRVTRPRRRWSWKRRIGLGALVVFVLLVVWAVVGYFSVRGGVSDANKRLARSAPGAASALTKQDGILLTASSDILLLGTDHSERADRAADSHSDSMLLLHTDPGRHRLVYLSIPRDLRVPIPGHGDDKINAAMQIGGPRLAIQTVRGFTGLDVDHVVVVDFSNFVSLIDKVGGVDIDVPAPILSNRFDCPYGNATRCQQWPGWRFRKGKQHMDGHRALIYSRIRENKLRAESDVTRGARQQQVMQALLSKLASVGTFFKLPFVGGDLLKPISTDLSTNEFMELAWVKFRAGNVLHCRLGGEDLGGGYLTSSEHNAEVIQMVLGNSAPQPPAPGSGPYGPGCVHGLEGFLS